MKNENEAEKQVATFPHLFSHPPGFFLLWNFVPNNRMRSRAQESNSKGFLEGQKVSDLGLGISASHPRTKKRKALWMKGASEVAVWKKMVGFVGQKDKNIGIKAESFSFYFVPFPAFHPPRFHPVPVPNFCGKGSISFFGSCFLLIGTTNDVCALSNISKDINHTLS